MQREVHLGALPSAPLPLADVVVLDLTATKSELTGRYLADLGADVILIEPPGGVHTRRAEPLHANASLRHATHHANKRGITLDLSTPVDREQLLRLVDRADILIEDGSPGALQEQGLSPDLLLARNPALVVVSVSDFGQSGPYRDWVATEWVHLAMGGVLSRSGLPAFPPLIPPGSPAVESAAIQAAWAALVAYRRSQDTGVGDHVDVAVYETTIQMLDPGFGIGGSARAGVAASDVSRGRPEAGHLYPIFPCQDGHVRICVLGPRQWHGMRAWLGEPAEFADPALELNAVRFAAAPQIYPAIRKLFANQTCDELVAGGKQFGVPIAALLTPGEVLCAGHYLARHTFTDMQVAPGVTAQVPNGFLEIAGARAGIRRPAPDIGEHNDEVLATLDSAHTHRRTSPNRIGSNRPLHGIRVLDLGVIVIGAELGRLLADQGAEVIKVENQSFPDGSRQTSVDAPINAPFAYGHRNKLGLGLNLRSARGVGIFKQLVAESDVILSNFKPGTMESLGLGYAALAEINPRIVVLESSAFGSYGPWSTRMGYGPLVRASTGLTSLWRRPEADESFSDASTIYPDHVAARVGATAVIAALVGVRRTGVGTLIELSQAETILNQMVDLFAKESLAAGSMRPVGNSRPGDAPRGVFACAGDDEWCVIDIRHDADWRNLVNVITDPALASDPELQSNTGRESNRARIDTAVAEWTATRSPAQVTYLLQSAGVPAGWMRRVNELPDDIQLQARGFFRTLPQPQIAEALLTENGPAHFRNTPDPEIRQAPLLGEHTRQICSTLLGLTAHEIDTLFAAGVLEEHVLDTEIQLLGVQT